MKAIVTKPVEIEIKSVIIDLPVRYDEEDMPNNFPHRDGDAWRVEVLVDSGYILDWPEGTEHELYMKVCDGGVYTLRGPDGEDIAERADYVPHGLIPGEYGDYVNLKIGGDGVITNWPQDPSVSEFFGSEEDD